MLVTRRGQRVKYIYIYIYIYTLSWLEKCSVRIDCLTQEYTTMALAGKGVPRAHSLRCSPKVQCSN